MWIEHIKDCVDIILLQVLGSSQKAEEGSLQHVVNEVRLAFIASYMLVKIWSQQIHTRGFYVCVICHSIRNTKIFLMVKMSSRDELFKVILKSYHIECFFLRIFLIVFLMLFSQTTKEMIARSCATIVTHPFHGKCNKYTFLDYDCINIAVNSTFFFLFHSSDHTQMHGSVHW